MALVVLRVEKTSLEESRLAGMVVYFMCTFFWYVILDNQ